MKPKFITVKSDKTFTIPTGTFVGGAFKEAAEYAAAMNEKNGGDLELTFRDRDITVKVRASSNHELLLRDWMRAEIGLIKEIGPYPAAQLTTEELAAQARKRQEMGPSFRGR